jgi:UDP-2,3-diacylglucosamine hydrolase
LCAERPRTTQVFLAFLERVAVESQALYILGDLFEYWAGDDGLIDNPHDQSVASGLKALSVQGVSIFVMHGNRDVLLSQDFAMAAGAALVPDPTEIAPFGTRVLLSHGDMLCTDDVAYQTFRQQVRDPAWQQVFLAQPLAARRAQIEALRQRSEVEKANKAEAIMDVNAQAVERLLTDHAFPPLLIHGHTHRPDAHALVVAGHHCTRWVLGDWHATGDYLRLDASGCSRHLVT